MPALTVPAATAAMFGVARFWARGDEPPVAGTFLALFKENLGRSLWVGLTWELLGAVLAADFFLVGQMSVLRRPLLVALFAVAVPYALMSVFPFPVMVNSRVGWRGL